ncbi:ephrin type-A receptor 7-like [Tubulanus polymorphus]|uniref:ephrin type-A receptor 7-like n=1 Tax=Tubulanus polymorphus TaxID=672921 RepID=UPI003DA20831
MTNFNHTRVTLSGLKPSKKYKVTIYARNGVSKISRTEWDFYEMIEFTTDAGTAAKDLNVGSTIIDGQFTLNIGSPKLSGQIEMFEIRYYPTEHPEKVASVQTKVAKLPFKNLTRNTQYAFQIRYKTKNGGWSDFSSVHYFKTGVDQAADSTPMGIIAGSIVAVAVCISIVIIMIFIFTRRNNQGCSEKNPGDCDNLQYTNMTVPLFTSPGSIRSYVDPHTYEDPHQAVREFTKEIDASHITIESVIGGGEFGDVCKGKLRIPTHMEMTVAIKTLKPGASEKNRLDFLTEASIMGQFEDANVIALEGVVTKSHPIMIVTEYMENGSLDSFLRNNDGQFTVMQLVGMLRGIASGMKYLSEMGYVHRDLAARNILANENLVCKVADFGLSREIESDDTDGAYTTKGGKIPVRWTAPEAIAYRKFTSASDVWSYGVVMWEVMSYGERPYWNWSNQDVIKAVEKGYRLPPPMDCPEAIHQLMLDCWQKERSHRPKFAATVRTIDKLIRAPELLRKVAKPRPYNTYETNVDLTRYDSLEEWLISIKMERYLESFLQYGYATIDSIAKITLKDLVNMGITLVGHQKKLMNSVQTMRVQIHGATVSDGFMV